MKTISFANGDEMPMLGLGTWKSAPGEVYDAVKTALDIGYRHVDCAPIYGNEPEVGDALQEAFDDGVADRDEVWVTSKLWNDAHAPEDVRPALEQTLDEVPLSETWAAMEDVKEAGLAHHIGVSNVNVPKLQSLIDAGDVTPEINQVELHPYSSSRTCLRLPTRRAFPSPRTPRSAPRTVPTR